jgi:predicted ATPase/DNA-binding SARP family transcriptional activator
VAGLECLRRAEKDREGIRHSLGAGQMPLVEFAVLGPLEATRGGKPIALGARRQRALLALLLIHANEVVPTERLIDELWGGDPPAGAAHSLQVYVSGLRRALEPERAPNAPASVVVTRTPGYVVQVGDRALDRFCFERLLGDGRQALREGDPRGAARRLGEALGLWRGPALVDFAYEGFAQAEAARLDELRIGALEDKFESELALGRHGELIGEIERAARDDPLRERLWGQWMLALYRAGRQAEALRAYQKLRAHLGDELGIAPSPELVALEEAIVLQKPELDWQVPERVTSSRAHDLPTGTVTFMFTDIESSTRLWDEHPEAMEDALVRHDAILRDTIESHRGRVVKSMGDGMVAVFGDAADAVGAAVTAQRALSEEPWSVTGPLRARMGLHTGEAQQRDGDYFGLALNRAARIMGAGHGGQVLCSAATGALVRDTLPAGVGLVDLGEHRLRDLSRSETIFQVGPADLEGKFPPLRSLDAFMGNLPSPVSSFIGRDRELAGAAAALGEVRTVTLTGVGGVGKTRLALQVAAEALPKFHDGAWWCELAPIRDRDGVTEAVAALFSVTPRAGETVEEALVEFLRHKELLLVLDNCEHLLEPVAHLVNTLERSCPRLVVLATSREGLGVDGERILPTPSLSAPPADAPPKRMMEADAVRLFVERAAAAAAGFELSDKNAAAVGQVCRRLDGVPLAIELAAARVPAMTPVELAERLDRRFQVLAGGRRGAVERHQTLRAAIDWSYDLLSESEQRLLARLAVFAGGCTLDAAEAVCGGDGIDPDLAFECLARLVSGSLVVAEEHRSQTRYRLLETIRQYGEERLGDAGEADTLRARHAGHYAAFAEEAFGHLNGPEHVPWAGRLSAERDNLLAAWSWAVDADDVDTAFRILSSVPRGHEGGYQVGLPGEAALTLSGATDHPEYPLALAITAIDAASRGDLDLAEERCSRALDADKRLHTQADSGVENLVCQARADIAMMRGAFADAVSYNEHAAHIARADGNLAVASVNLAFAAWVCTIAGDEAGAVPLAVEALALARQADMPYALITALLVLGIALADTDPDQARACLDESLDRRATLGYENANNLGLTFVLVSRLDDAPATLGIAGPTIRQLHWARQPVWLAASLDLIARALVGTRPDAAAIIQGAGRARTLDLFETSVDSHTNHTRSGPTPRTGRGYVGEVRRETTGLLAAELGNERLRQLRAEGEAMDDDRAVAYTLDQIAKALTDTTTQ